jgi:hypothetical protein
MRDKKVSCLVSFGDQKYKGGNTNQLDQHLINIDRPASLVLDWIRICGHHMNILIADSGVTINALHPGLVRGTQHLRHSPLSGSLVLRVPTLPWLWLLAKNAQQGAQTTIFLSVEPNLCDVSGKYFS